jgi:O-antigen biosynthesis protein
MKKVIIIPIHNQLDFLKKCVETVEKKTKNFELIIVDDGSTEEGIKEWLNSCGHTVIRHETAQGFSATCNDGILYAMKNFDFYSLCLLNSDTEIVTNGWFDRVEFEMKKHSNVALAGVVSNNATHQTIYDTDSYLKNIDIKPTFYANLVHGFCFFMSKEAISKLGPFDVKEFPHYGSEDDYALRSIRAGFKNIIVGSVLVNHNGSASYSKETREVILKKSVPSLLNRWTASYINECVQASLKIQNELNRN